MAAKFDQRSYDNAYKREKMIEAKARFSYASGSAQALLAACEKTGLNKSAYARMAILEKMMADGCFPSDYMPAKGVMPENQQETNSLMPEIPELEDDSN